MTSILRPLARPLAAAALFGAALSAPAFAQDASTLDREAIRAEVRALLKEEPQLVIEAMRDYEQQEEQRRTQQVAEALPQILPEVEKLVAQGERILIQGDPEGDVTLLELTDYNCPYCRAVQPEIQKLLEAQPKVRHVVKALAFIGSPFPEQAIAAAALQGDEEKVRALHLAMMGAEGGLEDERVLAMAAEVGLDAEQLAADVESPAVQERLERTYGLARALGIRGTPALIFPNQIAAFAPADELEAIVKEVRAQR